MDYGEMVSESILFYENAKKRTLEMLKHAKRPSTKLQLEKELEAFSHLKGFWDQEVKRIDLTKKYYKN